MVEKEDSDHAHSIAPLWTRLAAMLFSIVLVAAVFVLVAFFSGSASRPTTEVPHIIFILADDLGWNDVSFHGSPQIRTPNIDALAASGIVLNNHYTHSLCSPSRGALMSGKYANHLGLYEDLKPAQPLGLPLNIPTLPEYLQKLDYKTHMIGKWHLGYHKMAYFPTRRGFDSFYGFMNDYIDYYDYTTFYVDKSETPDEKRLFGIDLWENEEVVADFRGEYATNVFTQKTLKVIEQHNTTKPLFLFVSHAACHTGNSFYPVQTPVELVDRNSHIVNVKRRNYAGMVTALDDSIGKIYQSLREKGMLSKAIIIFTSDNGGLVGGASNWPLRGQRASGWEGGVRSPTVIWSPLLRLQKPRTSSQLMHITDWLPTIYHIAGGDVSDLGDIDGLNMWPVLLDANLPSYRDEILLQIDPMRQAGSLRKGDMKLLISMNDSNDSDWYGPSGAEDIISVDSMDDWIWKNDSIPESLKVDGYWLLTENDTWREDATILCGENFLPVSGRCSFTEGPCLYNITDDPCEYKNVAKLYPGIVQSLMERFHDMNASSVNPPEVQLDPLGNPLCHNFFHVPWMDDEGKSQCILTL